MYTEFQLGIVIVGRWDEVNLGKKYRTISGRTLCIILSDNNFNCQDRIIKLLIMRGHNEVYLIESNPGGTNGRDL